MADLQFNITAVFEEASVAFRRLADDLDTVKKKVDELNATKGEVSVDDKGIDQTKVKVAELKADVEDLGRTRATPEVDPKGIEETKAKVEEVSVSYDTLDQKTASPEVDPKGIEPSKLSLDQIFDKMDRLKGERAEPEVDPKVEPAKISLDDIKARIEALKNERADPEIVIKTGKAEEQLGAFANKMRLDIQAAIKSLPEVDLTMKLDATEFETHIQEIRAELAAMQNLVVKGTFDDAEFLIKLHELEAELKVLGTEDLTVRAKFDVATAMAALTAFRTEVEKRTELTVDTTKASSEIGAFAASMTARLDAAIKALPAIELHADSSEADTKIAELRTQLESLRDVTVTGHFDDAEMLARISELEASLKALSDEAVTVQAKFDYASAAAEIAAFRAAVEKKLEVNVGTDQAEASIGRFATDVRTKLEAAIKALPDVKITGDSSDVDQKIAAVRSLLESLKDKRIGIDIDQARFDAKLAVINAELEALSHKDINIPVRVDADAAQTALKGIGTDLDDAKGKVNSFSSAVDSFAGLMSTRMGLIGGSITPVLASIGQLSGALGLLPAVATAVGTGFAAVKVGTEGISQAIQSFSSIEALATKATDAQAKAQQAQATATQANTAAGQGNVAALKEQVTAGQAHVDSLKAQGSATAAQKAAIAGAQQQLSGYEAALKTAEVANTGNTAAQGASAAATKNAQTATSQANSAQSAYNRALEAYKVSLGNLAPSAQAFVTQLASMNSTFKDLKLDVQQHLFEGLAGALQSLASGALPTVRTGLTQMADAINTAVKNVTTFVGQQSSVTAWKDIFSNVSTAATNLAGAIKPILQIITDVTQVGSSLLPGLATSFANAAQAAADFVSKAKETGQLAQWIQAGLTAVGQLWDAFKNVVAIVKDLATAPGFAPSFLQSLDAVTTGIRWITDNVPLATTVVNLFFAAWVFAKITSGITSLVTSISGIGVAIDAAVAKFAALTGAETAAGVAAEGVAAGFTGMLGPLAALGIAVGVLVTHWDVVKQGFVDMAAVAVTASGVIVNVAQAIADAATGDFGAAGQAMATASTDFQAMKAAFMDRSGFDAATQGANGLTGAVDGTTSALQRAANAITGGVTSQIALQQAYLAVTKSVQDNGSAVATNTQAGIANNTAVAALINTMVSQEQAYAASGASIAAQTQMHNTNVTALQAVTSNNGILTGSVGTMVSNFTKWNPQLKLTPTADPSGVVSGMKTAQDSANSLKAPPPLQFKGDASDVTAKAGQAKTAAGGVPQPPTSQFKGDASDVTGKAGQAKTATGSVPQPPTSQFKGDANDVTAKAGQAKTATGSVPQPPTSIFNGDETPLSNAATKAHQDIISVLPSWLTTFLGAPDQLLSTVDNVSNSIKQVVQSWLTSFFGDSTALAGTTTQSNNLIDGVKSTHGSAFTGDPSGLNAAVATSVAGIASVNPAPPPVVFTADITDITTKTTDATTQINAVPQTHPTVLTADDTDVLAKDAAVIASLNSIPDHDIKITATDNATAVINSIVNSLNTLQDKTITITTVYRTVNAAGGLIATAGMANGGLVMPMANGGDLSPNMSASSAKVIPPNTWRVIGDRMTDDEAFIPINNSSSSSAILAETANRMGKKVMPMAGGGYNQRDDDAWDWLWGHHHGGGGTPPPTPPPTTPPPIPENWGGSASYGVALRQGYGTNIGSLGGGASEAVTRPVTKYARTGAYFASTPSVPTGSGSGSPPPVVCHIHFDNPSGNKIVDALFNEFRNNIRVQGGNVQMVLGKN